MAQLTSPPIDWADPSVQPQSQGSLVDPSSVVVVDVTYAGVILVAPTAAMLAPTSGGGGGGSVGFPIMG